MGRKKRKSKLPSLKLPTAGETIFIKKVNPINPGDIGDMFIDRMYAQGGFVVVQMNNYKTGQDKKKMFAPSEAAARLQAIQEGFPPQYIPDGFAEAVLKAVIAAKRQTLEGENELYKQNLDIDTITEELMVEIKEARASDPELNEEMHRIEVEESKA